MDMDDWVNSPFVLNLLGKHNELPKERQDEELFWSVMCLTFDALSSCKPGFIDEIAANRKMLSTAFVWLGVWNRYKQEYPDDERNLPIILNRADSWFKRSMYVDGLADLREAL